MHGQRHQPMDYAVTHTQTQMVKKKHLEVKKQMLYSTFSNIINILEEIESRQLQKTGQVPLPRSSTEWFDHSSKSIDTLDQVAQAQILVLESMMKTAEDQTKGPLTTEMFNKTKKWMGVREKRKLAIDAVDKYAYMILEIISFGKTSHNLELISTRTVDCKPTNEDTNCLLRGMYEAERKGKPFDDNPTKEAACPEIRTGDIKIVQITSGSKLIWGLDNTGMVHTLEISKAWKSMGKPKIIFKEIKTDIYDNGVFAVGINGILYERTGIKPTKITGDKWVMYAPTSHLKVIHVATCSTYILLQNIAYEFWYYMYRDKALHKLKPSEKSGEIEHFSCGKYHFWGFDQLHNFYNGTFAKGWTFAFRIKDINVAHVDTCDDGLQAWINIGTGKGHQLYISQYNSHIQKATHPVIVKINGRSIQNLIPHSDCFVVIDDNYSIWSCKDLSIDDWYQLPALRKDIDDERCLIHFSSTGDCTWAVDNFGNIFMYRDSKDGLIKWQKVPMGMTKIVKFTKVFASPYSNCVWALDEKGKPYCRVGITPAKIEGNVWKQIESPGTMSFDHLSITPNGVMALDKNREVWCLNISEHFPVGQTWEKQSCIINDILCDQRLRKTQNELPADDNSTML